MRTIEASEDSAAASLWLLPMAGGERRHSRHLEDESPYVLVSSVSFGQHIGLRLEARGLLEHSFGSSHRSPFQSAGANQRVDSPRYMCYHATSACNTHRLGFDVDQELNCAEMIACVV